MRCQFLPLRPSEALGTAFELHESHAKSQIKRVGEASALSGAYAGVSKTDALRNQAAATFGVSASAASKEFSIDAIVSSVSSPMFEMRKVFPFNFP